MPIFHKEITKSCAGFSLIEVLMVVVIFGVISVAVFTLMINYYRTSDLMSAQIVLQGEGRNALSQMVSDLRRINQGSTGASAIESATASSFVFYSNIDSDSYFEKVEYAIVGTELQKSVIKPDGNPLVYNPANKTTTVLSKKIANGANPLFSYYDNTYTGTGGSLTLPADFSVIRFVRVNVILDDNPAVPSSPLNMSASVALRNLKDN